ncbi:hypothetical protein M413DRAFT_190122 [Hebeloma cylindrosporum]|uniref:Transmembrane protein n=1 Tax=Hebeloma cylindrosporum TaxID=76867 RepID=A0A0C3BTL8_HEBCY|nr:hypothetical protein M413DRAFT_190122 [Hebeloma cylindrosporum h7]
MTLALEYPVTRTFRWRWFTPAALLGAFVVLVLLTLINIPLTGYETVTLFKDDYNVAENHWFYSFMPFRRHSGPICDARLFKLGDSFTTNYTFFDWSIESIVKPNAGKSGLFYTGTPLSSCDVSSIYINGDLHTWNVDFTVVLSCKSDDNFPITARTTFSKGFLPGLYQPLLATIRLDNEGMKDFRGMVLDTILTRASIDFGLRAFRALESSNYTTPMTISAQANFDPCPMSLGVRAPCALATPNITIIYAAVVYANSTILMYDGHLPINATANPWVLDDDTEQPLHNLLQAVDACIGVELGNPRPNNFILNPSFLNNSIVRKFPTTPWNADIDYENYSGLYYGWSEPDPILKSYLPVNTSGPANIQAIYPCQFQRRKSAGPLFVSVLVATLGMFSTGWALFILIASVLAKRTDPAGGNRCNGHCWRHRSSAEPNGFDCLELGTADAAETPIISKEFAYKPVISS